MRCVDCNRDGVAPGFGRQVWKLASGVKLTVCRACSAARGGRATQRLARPGGPVVKRRGPDAGSPVVSKGGI